MKKRYFFPRAFRATGRLMFFAGAMLGLGLTVLHIYLFFYRLANPSAQIGPVHVLPESTAGAVYSNPNPVASIVTIVLSVIVALGLIAVIIRLYNNGMRRIIARTARLFGVQIITVEIVGTLIAWTITILSLAFLVPAAAVIAAFAFIINELLFIFAWGAYGQPNYKI